MHSIIIFLEFGEELAGHKNLSHGPQVARGRGLRTPALLNQSLWNWSNPELPEALQNNDIKGALMMSRMN